MRLEDLKKKLIKTAITGAIGSAVAAGIMFAAMQYEDYETGQRDQTLADAGKIVSDAAALKSRVGKATEASLIYDKIMRDNPTRTFSLNREAASQLFTKLKTQFPLVDLKATISPIKEVPGPEGTKKTGKVVFSDVHITFDAPTDMTAFRFMHALATQFPGLVSFQSVRLNKKSDFNDIALQELGENHIPILVSADITFSWLGIRLPEAVPSGVASAAAGAAPKEAPTRGRRR